MTANPQIPLGQRIPDSVHAVSVSMPTMADVIGYEEKKPQTLAKLSSGYPRFVVHEYLRNIERHWQRLFETPEQSIWLTSSERMAKELQDHLGDVDSTYIRHKNISGLRLQSDAESNQKAKLFLQHVGGFPSSREAEDYLVSEGLLDAPYPEKTFSGDPQAHLLNALSDLYHCPPSDIVLTNSGMNAFYSAFCAINEIQAPQGKRSWIKLGWLYADTMNILDKLGHEQRENIELLDVLDMDALENALEGRAGEIAAIVTEAPTNPLIQSMDLDCIRELATKHSVYLVVDPTVASVSNVDVSPYSDVIVNSLTKYLAIEGDVIMGALAATDACPEKESFLKKARDYAQPPYHRDAARIALQVDQLDEATATINRNTRQIVAFLESHPKVSDVYWPLSDSSKANFARIARSPDAVGGLISFRYDGPLERFYDRLPLAKGPSFGMRRTLACPYIYLAHYALATSPDGKATLAKAGIHPELIRFSVGVEPSETIIAALEQALAD